LFFLWKRVDFLLCEVLKPFTQSVLFGVLKGREMGDFLQIELAHCVLTHFSLCWQMRNA